MDYSCNINHVVETLKNGKENKKKCSLLIGAGCSVTAKVPTANGFVEEIKKRYKEYYDRASVKTYPQCMTELAPGQRKTLIKEFVDKAKINWSHICIAQLMKAGYVDRVLTTNFDLLVVRACALLGEFPSVYDFASSQVLKPAEITDNAVFYLHGQYTGFVLMNTEEEVKKHSELLAPVFEDAQRGRSWIVVGYSGDSDPVFDHLSKVKCFDDNLYWIGHGKKGPSDHVREKLLLKDKYAYFIEDYDSDRFFITLAQELNCFPPKIFSNPFTHLKDIFKSFTPFPILGSELDSKKTIDFTDKSKKMISEAIRTIEKGESKKKKLMTKLQKDIKRAEEFYMKGEYEKVISLEKNIKKDKKAKDMIYWSLISIGNSFLNTYRSSNKKENLENLYKALKYYTKAKLCKTKPHEALYNWGIALTDLARINEKSEEKEKLYKESIKKYEEALKIKPDKYEALYNWGVTLTDLARINEKSEEKEKLYKEGIKKYEEALKIKPDYHEAFNVWGNALIDLAEIKESPEEKEKLYNEGIMKYEEVLKIKPDYHFAFNGWGNALIGLARIKEKTEEKEKLYNEGIMKYEEALKIKPDLYFAFNGWGIALTDLARIRNRPEEKNKYFNDALNLFNKAELIKKGFSSYNLACAYSLLSNFDKCKEYLVRSKNFNYQPNCNHLKNDSDLNNVRGEQWYQEFEKEICKEK